MTQLIIKPVPPFDLRLTVEHRTSPHERFSAEAYLDGKYLSVHDGEGTLVLVEVTSTGSVSAPQLSVSISGDAPHGVDGAAIAGDIAFALNTDFDLRPFYRTVKDDPVLSQAVRVFRGLHPPKNGSLFQSLVLAIMGQQISGAAARAIRGRIIEALGTPLSFNGTAFHLFPKAESFLACGQEVLRSLGLSNRKAEYVLEIAAREMEGFLDIRRLERLDNEEVLHELVQLRGIGPWTVQWLLIGSLGRMDAFPAGDLALQRAISENYLDGRRIGEKEAAAFAQERWPGYAGLATIYLFANLRHQRTALPSASGPKGRAGRGPTPSASSASASA